VLLRRGREPRAGLLVLVRGPSSQWIVAPSSQRPPAPGPTRKIVIRRPAAGSGMALFTTAFGLYDGVLWSGEFQGLIVHELVPTGSSWGLQGRQCSAARSAPAPAPKTPLAVTAINTSNNRKPAAQPVVRPFCGGAGGARSAVCDRDIALHFNCFKCLIHLLVALALVEGLRAQIGSPRGSSPRHSFDFPTWACFTSCRMPRGIPSAGSRPRVLGRGCGKRY
jgi:hypothetical protein